MAPKQIKIHSFCCSFVSMHSLLPWMQRICGSQTKENQSKMSKVPNLWISCLKLLNSVESLIKSVFQMEIREQIFLSSTNV